MTTQTNILYPIARSDSGQAVHVGEASKGCSYECFGCSAPMVAKQGGKRRWHFAHKPPFERCADPDKALHDTAKALIMQGFSGALARQGAYRLGCPCEECGRPVSRNIAVPGAKVEAEKSVVAGTRSDLVVNQPGRGPVIIEVVVTHDLEPESRESYEKSGTPILKIRPTWDTLDKLESEVISDDTLNVPPVRCASCKRATERRRREREQIQERVDSMLRQLNERRQPDQGKFPFRPWTHDQFERPMFPRIRQQAYTNALILTGSGFVQAKQKPWLFLFRLPGGVFFANFGSNEEVAIWEDPAAFIHWKLDRYSEEIEKATSRVERFHSQFLADALCESLKGDRSLFDQVWTLVAPSGWEIPQWSDQVRVVPEQKVEGGRVDICIHCFAPQDRVVGIEIKTVEDSTEPGQLERYRAGLKRKFWESEIQIAYLTPFNREHAGNGADSLPTVMEFERFKRLNPEARPRHVSWLDLESIPWDGDPLWEQHRAYVRNHISSPQNRRASVEQNRDLAFFFGVEPAERFWAEVRALTVKEEGKRVFIDLADQPDPSAVAKSLVRERVP